MKTFKKKFFIASVLLILLTFSFAGCSKEQTSDEEKYRTPDIDVSYLTGQTVLDKTVEKSNELKNGVQAYYDNGDRHNYIIENQTMKMTHNLSDTILVTSLQNRQGDEYLSETMDSYVVYDGQIYYASQSPTSARVNTTRLGYYYYSVYVRDIVFDSHIPVYLEKAYHTYSDRMHQAFRIVPSDTDTQITEFGFETTIPQNLISSLEICADGTTYTTLEQLSEINKVEYVGFDIKDSGVIGFIFAGQNTKVVLTSTDDAIVLKQFVTLEGVASENEVIFANRLYVDETHNFEGLQKANAEEQNPLTSENITVDEDTDGALFVGYNHMTGAYDFELDGNGFSTAYYYEPEKKFYENIAVTNIPDDRTIFLRVHTSNPLEGAALLDEDEKLLPIPLQCGKNFGHEKEEPLYNPEDLIYGETYMPLVLEKDREYKFSIINIYKHWGNYDLKQLSSIDYFVSYYHLSTGVTETNCIAPYYAESANGSFDFAWFIPDFRGASGNFWGNEELKLGDPQYNSVGTVYAPTNNQGFTLGNYLSSNIKYSGLTYADLEYSYVSDDGNYKYTMRHFELPQNDESRTYYTIDFEILEDCTLDNTQFSIIAADGRNGIYSNAAYMDENGTHQEITIEKALNQMTIYPLNEGSSYFAFYGLPDELETETGNFGLIVKDYSITVGGKKSDVGLAFLNDFRRNTHWGAVNYGSLTLSETTKFHKGDTIHVDLILLPFGLVGQDDCQNVVNVYQDSVVNAIQVEAQVGKVIKDTYLPTIASENNVAEFTLTGGLAENGNGVNYAVKVQGFDKLTIPKIYENINGEWIEYKYSTEIGYDGYGVQLEDSKLSYSFVFTQTTEGRTFKVVAE